MNIGEQIRTYRKKAGLSQKELGMKLEVSQQNIAQYENGLRKPKIETLYKIADAFDVLPDDIKTNDETLSSQFLNACVDSWENLQERQLIIMKVLEKNADKLGYTFEVIPWSPYTRHLRSALDTTEQLFKKLNEEGQDKALELIELLTKIPEYQREHE